MKNIKKLLEMFNNICENSKDLYMGCSVCPNYNCCSKGIWEKAYKELEEIEQLTSK